MMEYNRDNKRKKNKISLKGLNWLSFFDSLSEFLIEKYFGISKNLYMPKELRYHLFMSLDNYTCFSEADLHES